MDVYYNLAANQVELPKVNAEEYPESIHEIVARTTIHYLRMPAMPNLANLEDSYLEHTREQRFPPLHVFLAERNASSYEKVLFAKKHPGSPGNPSALR